MRGLDAYITSGRYSKAIGWAQCPKCGNQTMVVAETEYGGTTWEPGECETKGCGHEFTGEEPWEDAEPDPDLAYDRMRDDEFDA